MVQNWEGSRSQTSMDETTPLMSSEPGQDNRLPGKRVEFCPVFELSAPESGTFEPSSAELTGDEGEGTVDILQDHSIRHWLERRFYLIMSVSLFLIGTLWFWIIQGESLINSMYFIVIMFTTVGYGLDDNLDTDSDYLFLSIYAIACVGLLGSAVSSCVSDFLDGKTKETKFLNQDLTATRVDLTPPTLWDDVIESDTTWVVLWLFWGFAGALLIGSIEGWTSLQSIYFAVISGTTIGFGDIEPDSYTGRALTIIYLPILILLTAYLLARLYAQTVEAFLGDLQFQNLQDTMGDMLHSSMGKDQFISQLILLDIDDDGELTRNEFIVQMLINEYDVPLKYIKAWHEHFDALDADRSGFISQKDISNEIDEHNFQKEDPMTTSEGVETSVDLSDIFGEIDSFLEQFGSDDLLSDDKKEKQERITATCDNCNIYGSNRNGQI